MHGSQSCRARFAADASLPPNERPCYALDCMRITLVPCALVLAGVLTGCSDSSESQVGTPRDASADRAAREGWDAPFEPPDGGAGSTGADGSTDGSAPEDANDANDADDASLDGGEHDASDGTAFPEDAEAGPSDASRDGADAMSDAGKSDGCLANGCGGCEPLTPGPGAHCGACGSYVCDGKNAVKCVDPGYAKVTAITAGKRHSCALFSTGGAYCWGENVAGQLGDGTIVDRSSAVRVSGLTGATALAAGGQHTCALLSNGTMQCWGNDGAGQLGFDDGEERHKPTTVPGLAGVQSIAAGYSDTCAISAADKSLRCWGYDYDGQLGDADADGNGCSQCETFNSAPKLIAGLPAVSAVTIADMHACALLGDTSVRCWGYNWIGQIGAGPTDHYRLPSASSVISGVRMVAAYNWRTCVVLSTGGVRCWGDCINGACGDPNLDTLESPPSKDILTGASAITVGYGHNCALLSSSGEVRCWGQNGSGELGNPIPDFSATPVAVTGITGATAIAAGSNHTCALVGGVVKCWGNNDSYELGDLTSQSRDAPVVVQGLNKVCR